MKKLLTLIFVITLCFGIPSMASALTFPKDVFSTTYDGLDGDGMGGVYKPDYHDGDILTIDKNSVHQVGKVEFDDKTLKITATGGFGIEFDKTGVYTSGTWTGPKVDYITIKAGTGFVVYDVSKMGKAWSTDLLEGKNLSHITFWSKTAVPAPAAVWLLGTGLAGLIGVRRKMKK